MGRPPTQWADSTDDIIVRGRAAGWTWDSICSLLGLGRWTVIERGRRLGAVYHPPVVVQPPVVEEAKKNRDVLPPGHAVTWGAITRGTCLEGLPYPEPVSP